MILPTLSVKPRALALVLLISAMATFAVGLFVVDRAGEAIITEHQRLVAETARDFFVAMAHEEGLTPLARTLDIRALHETGALRYALFDAEGRQLAGNSLLPGTDLPPPGFSVRTIGTGEQALPYEVLVQPISSGATLIIYENLTERAEFHSAILRAAGTALLASVFVVAAASFFLGRVLLRRAEGIVTVAQHIAAGDLSARAPVGVAGDVFDNLATSVNAMLERIDELLTGLRTVTDSLAHDLRSPLTRLRGSLTNALDPKVPEGERMEMIVSALGEAEDVLATFGALVDIARAEAGLSREMMAPVDVVALVLELGEFFSPVIEDAKQELTVRVPPDPITVNVHDLILRQALGNLLHNATRYAGEGAQLELALEMLDGNIRIVVADNGPGVPPEDRGRVLQRFVRLDSSRGSHGSGLGLAIAAACAKLHGGTLSLGDNHPGLRAVLEFPATV